MTDDCTGFPEAIAGVDISGCCRLHDEAFARGGDLFDFLTANLDLGTCVTRLSHSPPLLAIGVIMATGTTLFGGVFWLRARWRRARSPLFSPGPLRAGFFMSGSHMDTAGFFAAIRSRPFGGSLAQEAVDGINAIIGAFEAYGDGDERKLAYILGTAFHEADRFRTMREYANGEAYEGRSDLGNTQPGDGRKFRGRGFVQVTGRANYADWSKRLGLDLIRDPGLAEQRPIAARILVEGMMLGTFTGKKLPDYITTAAGDYLGARRVVNGTDKATMIAGYAKSFEAALTVAGFGEAETAPAVIVVDHAQPAPAATTPMPPIAQTPSAGPTSKATGGAVGAAIPNAILLLLVKLHVIPADVASDPETILLLTTLLTAAGAWFGAFMAPRNGVKTA